MRYFGLISATLLAVPAAAPSQVTVVDEGSFTISRSGDKIGREVFTIRRTPGPGGDVYVANATVEFDAERLSPALRADDSFAPLAYQLEVREGGEVRERLRAIVGRGRISAQVKTARGESTKEYIVADGALVLDDHVFHQYYFLARRASRSSGGTTVPVVVPQRNAQVVMHLSAQGSEAVTIGGRGISARLFVLTEPGGGTRQVWVDDQGRVLKVALDSRGITAVRDEAPR